MLAEKKQRRNRRSRNDDGSDSRSRRDDESCLTVRSGGVDSSSSPISNRFGIYKRKYHVRFIVQTFALLGLVGVYGISHMISPGQEEHPESAAVEVLSSAFERDIMEPLGVLSSSSSALTDHMGRRRLQDASETLCSDIAKADPVWFIVFYIIGIIYMFLALAIACDEFFVPALEEMSSERRLNLSMDVAGATLMAAGGSAPELFTSLFGTFQESEIGFGTIVGSAVFNVLFVIAMCSLLAKEVLQLTWWPLFRDSLYYAIGLAVLAVFVGAVTPEEIHLWEACVLFAMYIGYILLMYFNARIYKYITGKEYVHPEEEEEEEDEIDDDDEEMVDDGDADEEKPKKPRSQGSVVSAGSFVLGDGGEHGRPVNFRWQGTFRAGILKLLRDPDSWVDTAGVGIVAKLAGDVDQVFREVDVNGDGEIDVDELEKLFEMLDCHLTATELEDVFQQLDEDGDGKIGEEEFSKWYVRSEERILAQVKHVFDSFDTNQSNTIDREELRMLLEKLEPRVTDEDVDDAIGQMYKSGSRDEITFDEFSEWYRKSLIYERQKKAVEEDMAGVWENLKPPFGEDWGSWFKYFLVLPLVAAMTLTIPDVQRPGMGKWCYVSFIMSIIWIGGFAYFMVDWAEVVGNTIGIPSVVMGLTILAAGTSVPDLLSSVIVARRGNGDMAVSSSIGSNIFDILVGLPIPWIAYTSVPMTSDIVSISADSVARNVYILLGMLVFVIIIVHCQKWRLTKTVGGFMLLFYIGYLIQGIVFELPFEVCVNEL